MMISLSTLLFDLDGYFVLHAAEGSDFNAVSRRVNRVATLDGGAAVNDFGFSHADRRFTVASNVTKSLHDRLQRTVELHGRLRCCTREGVFLVAIESMTKRTETRVVINLLVLRKET